MLYALEPIDGEELLDGRRSSIVDSMARNRKCLSLLQALAMGDSALSDIVTVEAQWPEEIDLAVRLRLVRLRIGWSQNAYGLTRRGRRLLKALQEGAPD